MQPATLSSVKNREDICIYCGKDLDVSLWKDSFLDKFHYSANDCSECGRTNRLNLTRKVKDDHNETITRMLTMEYPKRFGLRF